jgi:hypothetical protein
MALKFGQDLIEENILPLMALGTKLRVGTKQISFG